MTRPNISETFTFFKANNRNTRKRCKVNSQVKNKDTRMA